MNGNIEALIENEKEWRRHLVHEGEKSNKLISDIKTEQGRQRIMIEKLKIKSVSWGALGGGVVSLIGLIIAFVTLWAKLS